jgi:hypothetical protein
MGDASESSAWRGIGQIWRRDREHWTELGHEIPLSRQSNAPMIVFQRLDVGVYVAAMWNNPYSHVELRSAEMARRSPSATQRLSARSRPRAAICTNLANIASSDDGTRLAVVSYSGVFVCAVPSLEILSTVSLPGWRFFRPFDRPLIALDVEDLCFMPNSYGLCLVAKRSYSYLPASVRPRVWLYIYDPNEDVLREAELQHRHVTDQTRAFGAPTGRYVCVREAERTMVYSSTTSQIFSYIERRSQPGTLTFVIPRARTGSHLIRVSHSDITLCDLHSGRNVFTLKTDDGYTVSGTTDRALLEGYFAGILTAATNVSPAQTTLPWDLEQASNLRRTTLRPSLSDFALMIINRYTALLLFLLVDASIVIWVCVWRTDEFAGPIFVGMWCMGVAMMLLCGLWKPRD